MQSRTGTSRLSMGELCSLEKRQPMQSQKVLIIDDDPQLIQLLEIIFAKEGAQVYGACDGFQGLRAFSAHRPDLVILDLMMPGMDGWQVCSHLRQQSSVPILLLSATGRDQDIARGLAGGADDYVTKPFSPGTLVSRAQALLHDPEARTRAQESPLRGERQGAFALQGQRAFAG